MRFREAPLPAHLRRALLAPAEGALDPAVLGAALGRPARDAARARPPPHRASRASAVTERLAHLRTLLRRGRFSFDEAVRGADRMTVAVTLFALLELYKRGEASWEQDEPFGEITVRALAAPARRGGGAAERRRGGRSEGPRSGGGASRAAEAAQETGHAARDGRPARAHRRGAAVPLAATRSAPAELAEATGADEAAGRAARSTSSRRRTRPGERGIALRELAGGYTLASDPIAEDAARRCSAARASRR